MTQKLGVFAFSSSQNKESTFPSRKDMVVKMRQEQIQPIFFLGRLRFLEKEGLKRIFVLFVGKCLGKYRDP